MSERDEGFTLDQVTKVVGWWSREWNKAHSRAERAEAIIRELLEMSDPDHERFCDSAADVVERLWLIGGQYRAASLTREGGE